MFLYNDSKNKSRRKNLRHNATDAEKKIWGRLRNKQIDGLKFYRQYNVGRYVLDFYCPVRRLAIEIDGGQHNEIEERIYDADRTAYLAQQEIRTIRFWNNEALQNIEGVVEKIRALVT